MTPTNVRAVLDANVIVPAPLRDTLFRAAAQRLYDVRLSADILEEMRRTLVTRGFASHAQAERLVATIRASFQRSMVTGHELLIQRMTNDEGDRHVRAAAVQCDANFVVTSNVRHFPQHLVQPIHVEIVTPDEFLMLLLQNSEQPMIEIIQRQASDLRSPPMSVVDVLDRLRQQAPTFADHVTQLLGS